MRKYQLGILILYLKQLMYESVNTNLLKSDYMFSPLISLFYTAHMK